MPYALLIILTTLFVILFADDADAGEPKYLANFYEVGYKYRVSCEGMRDVYSNDVTITESNKPVPKLRIVEPVDERNRPVSKEVSVAFERCAVFIINETPEVR